MKMRNYMKKSLKDSGISELTTEEILGKFGGKKFSRGKLLLTAAVLLFAIPIVCGFVFSSGFNMQTPEEMDSIQLVSVPAAATSTKKDLISIPSGTIKSDPFLPYRNISGTSVVDVPKFNLVEPPEVLSTDSDAARVMDTTVSGILYDKYSPSAILNIEGNDYLVKKGDTVNNYKVINIMQDSVTVKLGANTYKAGIGEILTEGSLTQNDVSNLNNKFGGKKE